MITQLSNVAPAAAARTVASTPAGGVALINGTQTILSWTPTNDSTTPHLVTVSGEKVVTGAETGGAIQIAFTQGGQARVLTLNGGGQGAGGVVLQPNVIMADAGTTVQVNQSSALTAGASTVACQISADHA